MRATTMGDRPELCLYARSSSDLLRGETGRVSGGAEVQYAAIVRALAKQTLVGCIIEKGETPSLPCVRFAAVDSAAARGRGVLGAWRFWRDIVRAVASIDSPVVMQRSASPDTALVALAAKVSGRKFVFHWAHDIDRTGGHIRPFPLRWAYRAGRALAHTQIVQTREQAAMARGRVVVVPNAVDTSIDWKVAPPGDHVLWVASIKELFKQPHLFLDIAERLPHRRFLMAGEIKGSPEFQRIMSQRISKLPNVRHLGLVDRRTLPSVYAQARCLVNTSYAEGFSNTFLEAAACGVPVVSLHHDPNGILAEGGAGWCAQGSMDNMVETIERMFDEKTWRTHHEACAIVAEQHAPEAIARRILEIAVDVAGAPRRGSI